jgi:hypothetical protein
MEQQKYYIKIGLGDIENKIFPTPFSANCEEIIVPPDECCPVDYIVYENCETGITYVYSSMTQILSGGTGGTSLLTGLTIPILLTQTTNDFGFYSVFDGTVQQKEVLNNFVFSATTGSPYQVFVYNTSNSVYQSTFEIDWGDGSPSQQLNIFAPSSLNHNYPVGDNSYTITVSGVTPWGVTVVSKTINLPYQNITPQNPNGTVVFYPQGGNWSGIPISYDYLYTGDSNTNILDYITSSYINVPFLVTGYTVSNLQTLQQYGPIPYPIGTQLTGSTGSIGVYYGSPPSGAYSAYTINGVDYWDLSGGTTIYFIQSSGLTSNDLILSAITKEEYMIGVVFEQEVRSDIYIERGKISALEPVQRLGEVDGFRDLIKYGYGYFKVETQ